MFVRRDKFVVGLDQRELTIVTNARRQNFYALGMQELGGLDVNLTYLCDCDHRSFSSVMG